MKQDFSVKALSERLNTKNQADRKELETLTEIELRELTMRFRESVNNAFNTIDTDMKRHTSNMKEHLASTLNHTEQSTQSMKQLVVNSWIRPTCWAIASLAAFFIVTWAVTESLVYRVKTQWQETSALSQMIEEQNKTLDILKAQTWGIDLIDDQEKGRFIVLPEGMNYRTGWSVAERKAIKLHKD